MDRPALLLTRPVESAQAFVGGLDPEALNGVTICLSPLLKIVPVEAEVDLGRYSGAIFTSANGVAMAPAGAGRHAACVGARTASAAQARGWDVKRVAPDADALVTLLVADPVPGPLIHIAGQHRRGDIAARLSAAGLTTDEVVLYDQILMPLTDAAQAQLSADRGTVVPLFSPRTARQFMREAAQMRAVTVVAISDAVAKEIDQDRIAAVHIVAAPTADAMRLTVEKLLREDSLP